MVKVGKILLREGSDIRVSALLYRAEIQVVPLFGLDSWLMSNFMMKAVEGTHVGFFRQITGKSSRRQSDGSWETPVA